MNQMGFSKFCSVLQTEFKSGSDNQKRELINAILRLLLPPSAAPSPPQNTQKTNSNEFTVLFVIMLCD